MIVTSEYGESMDRTTRCRLLQAVPNGFRVYQRLGVNGQSVIYMAKRMMQSEIGLDADDVIGYVSIVIDMKVVTVSFLSVREQWRNRRVGTLLMVLAAEYAMNEGCISMELDDDSDRAGLSHNIYTSLGFSYTNCSVASSGLLQLSGPEMVAEIRAVILHLPTAILEDKELRT